jgi:hypothetical protein
MADKKLACKLALRVEGNFWNAYIAFPDDKERIHLGGINMRFVRDNDEAKHDFIELMKMCMSDTIKEALDIEPEWGGLEPAPESERAGSA